MTARAGSLREACVILSQTNAELSGATTTVQYSTVAQVACAVKNVSPFANLSGRGYTNNLAYRFIIRWRADVDIANVILYKDKRYGIATMVDQNDKRQYLELFCYIRMDDGEATDPSPTADADYGVLYNGFN